MTDDPAFWVLLSGLVVLFFLAPFYTILGGLAVFIVAAYLGYPLRVVFTIYEVFGFVWVLTKIAMRRADERQKLEWERRCEEDAEKDKQREKRKRERERKSTIAENRELVARFATLVASCDSAWADVMRTAKAFRGDFTSPSFTDVVKHDVLQILKVISVANGTVSKQHGRQCHAILAQLEPDTQLTIQDCVARLECEEHEPLGLPAAVGPLSAFDQAQGTRLAADAAGTYWALIVAACEPCQVSLAVTAVRVKYFDLFKPYLAVEGLGNGTRSFEDGSNQFNGNCPQCRKYYAILELPGDATEEAIETARRDLQIIYHPDRFQSNERLRRKNEERFKDIEQAYTHIKEHLRADRR